MSESSCSGGATEAITDEHQVTRHRSGPHHHSSRGVTLAMLIRGGIIKPAKSILSIDYLGRRFVADLMEDGRIYWAEGNEEFGSPSAWAVFCKRLSNPDSKSGCGWASVKYAGRKLDSWKTSWYRQTQANRRSEERVQLMSGGEEADDNTSVTTATQDRSVVTDADTDIDVRTIDPLDLLKSEQIIDQNQLLRVISLQGLSVEQPLLVEMDSSIPFLVTVFTHRGHDINGLLLGSFSPHGSIRITTLVAIPADEEQGAHVRSRIVEKCFNHGAADAVLGWFVTHFAYRHCGPTVGEVCTQEEIQQSIWPFVAVVFNCNIWNIVSEFTMYVTSRLSRISHPVPVSVDANLVNLGNFASNLKEMCTHITEVDDEEIFVEALQNSPCLLQAIPEDTQLYLKEMLGDSYTAKIS